MWGRGPIALSAWLLAGMLPCAQAGVLSEAERSELFSHELVSLQSAPVPVRVNGVSLWWSECRSALPPAALLKALGPGWHRALAPAAPGNAWLFSKQLGLRLHTLQLQASSDGGSSGRWSMFDASQPPQVAPRPPLPLPATTHVDTVIEQLDGDARSTQYLGAASPPPALWQSRALRLALAAGWRRQGATVEPRPGEFQALVRGNEQVDLLVLPGNPGSRFVLNRHPAPGAAP